jgi:hypothetical protein
MPDYEAITNYKGTFGDDVHYEGSTRYTYHEPCFAIHGDMDGILHELDADNRGRCMPNYQSEHSILYPNRLKRSGSLR